jgi:hypothetical protein
MNAFAQILTPTINADIRDYQQYISGERIDGMFSTITAIGGIITVATSGIISFLYEKFGINEETATRVINDPTVMNRTLRNGSVVGDVVNQAIESGTADISYFSLYDNNILQNILTVLIIVSIIGAIINVIPYFFYDLTEIKQQGIVKVLKIRAFFEDFGNNTLSDSDLVEVIEMVETANELIDQKEVDVTKDEIKQARASKDQEALKIAKANYKKALQRNDEIKLAPFVIKEMKRFDSELGAMQVADANMIYSAGYSGLMSISLEQLKEELKNAKALPKNTEEEKEIRKYKIDFSRKRITAKKYCTKYYSQTNEIIAPDDTHLNELYNTEEQYDTKQDELYKKLFEAKENKDKELTLELKKEIKELEKKSKVLNKQINDEQNKRLSYNRSAKPVLDAQKLLKQAENYTHFEEIKERYEEAKKNIVAVEV